MEVEFELLDPKDTEQVRRLGRESECSPSELDQFVNAVVWRAKFNGRGALASPNKIWFYGKHFSEEDIPAIMSHELIHVAVIALHGYLVSAGIDGLKRRPYSVCPGSQKLGKELVPIKKRGWIGRMWFRFKRLS